MARVQSIGRLMLVLCAATLLAAACSPVVPAPGSAATVPAGEWTVSTPEEQGMQPELLDEMLAEIVNSRLPLHSLVIVRHGVIVQETYFSGYNRNSPHELYSVTKSVISTLIGIAIEDGKIEGVGAKVLPFFDEQVFDNLDDRKKDMTLEDLLTMTSGLEWGESENDFSTMVQSSDWVRFMLDKPVLEAPGSSFNYCSGCSHVLSGILSSAVGGDVLAYADQSLFAPLGIREYTWETDAHDLPIGGWGLKLTPRDMARFGQLFLNEGKWDNEQVVPAGWVKNATRKHIAAEENWDYGYQWWVYPALEAYAAIGRGGQTVVVLPGLDMVVVTTAALPNSEPVFDLIERYVVPAARP